MLSRQTHFSTACAFLTRVPNSDSDGPFLLPHLQTLLCAAVFLILLSRPSTAYTYIGLAAVSAAKSGLLAQTGFPIAVPPSSPGVGKDDGPESGSSDKRQMVAAALVTIDTYLSTILGLPRLAHVEREHGSFLGHLARPFCPAPAPAPTPEEDQGTVLRRRSEIDDGTSSLRVVSLTAAVLRHFGETVGRSGNDSVQDNGVDEALLRNVGRDLASLSKDLGLSISPAAAAVAATDDLSFQSVMAKCDLELTIYWSQLSVHLPFLHYLRPLADGQPIPDAASRPALTCLKIAVNVIVRCDSLLRSLADSDTYGHIMHPSNWTCIYTVFLAVVALVFLISIHQGTSKPSEAWRKADTGIRILVALRCKDGGAVRCLAVIKKLVSKLNYTVDFDFENIEKTTRCVCETRTKLPTLSNILDGSSKQSDWSAVNNRSDVHESRQAESNSSPMSSADKMLAHAQSLLTKSDSLRSQPGSVG